jgi:3',5'-cyclic AMP phosphodiesterase CpdA
MPTLIQLSDLHFGPHHSAHLDELILKDITALQPDAVVFSGDFTMRARHAEFAQTREFLARLSRPWLAIPGNHDQPVFDPLERLLHQYARYEKHVHPFIDTTLAVDGLFILGLNDNHPVLPGGFWSRTQRAWIAQQLADAPSHAVRIVVTHHHFSWGKKFRPAGFWFPNRTLDFLARGGVELVLNGHTHVPGAEQAAHRIVIARAGTAASGRTRLGHSNSYNLIKIDQREISVFVRIYNAAADAFLAAQAFTFPRRLNYG